MSPVVSSVRTSMPIFVTCECGRNLKLKDSLAGKKVRCPDCSKVVAVPKSSRIRTGRKKKADSSRRSAPANRATPERRRRPARARNENVVADDIYGTVAGPPPTRKKKRANRKSKRVPKVAIAAGVASVIVGLIGAVGYFVVPRILEAVQPDPEVEAARTAYLEFLDVLRSSALKGEKHAACFDEETCEYFREAAAHCLTAERATLSKLPYTQMFYALDFRHGGGAVHVSGMSGREVIAYAFEAHYMDGAGFRLKPDRIEIRGDTAFVFDNQAGDFLNMKMVRENGEWKINLVHMYRQVEKVVEAEISGDRENYVLDRLASLHWAGPADERLFRLPINGTSYYK